MKLRLYKKNGKYAFSIDGFSSVHHHLLIPDVSPTYKYAWQAYSTAKNIFEKKAYHVEALCQKRYAIEDLSKPVRSEPPVEELLVDHYKIMLSDMSRKTMGIDDNSIEEKDITYLVLKSQVEDLLRVKENIKDVKQKAEVEDLLDGYRKIAKKHFQDYLNRDKKKKAEEIQAPSPPEVPAMEEGQPAAPNMTMASNLLKKTVLTEDESGELLEHYGERICSAISKHHPDAICKISAKDGIIKIIGLDSGKSLLQISMNDKFNINNITPMESLIESFPAYSSKFYQRYWKPIVESVGHFFLDELDSLILPEIGALPDMPNKSGDFDIRGWNPRERKEIPLKVSFKEKSPIWLIASGASKKVVKTAEEYTEEDFLRDQPTRVRCIDQKLSLFGKIGEVVQIVPISAGVGFELDINFGRKVVRLSKNQVEIVNDL